MVMNNTHESASFVYQKIQFQLHIEFDTTKHEINIIISLLVIYE